MFKFLSVHKVSLLSGLLMVLAVLLGADCGFAMAVDAVDLAAPANPSSNMEEYNASTNPGGRPADETLQTNEQGGKTELQGKPATGTDVMDAGLEAEDYDKDVDNFRKFKFPIETYIARQCRPVKAKSYVHGHYRSGSTDLCTSYTGSDVTITAGSSISGTWDNATKVLKLAISDFDNAEIIREHSTFLVRGVAGYKSVGGTEIPDGELVLFCLRYKDGDEKAQFRALNPPVNTTGTPTSITLASGTELYKMASAGSESQMRVASETYLPEKFDVTLQKKIVTCTVTDYFEDQEKKVSHKTKDVLAHAEENFKRECARSHWAGTGGRIDINVSETGGREFIFFENGILRQVNMLYTHGSEFTDDDLLALTTLMFTENSMSDSATAFCGKKAMQRFIRLVNSADKYKDVGKVEVNNYGIRVRNYGDNFGNLEFVWDPTLDDLGYEEYMVILDLRHATRPYILNDKKTTRDMSKTGEAREAKEYNLCRIDCVALNGFNSILVCPSSLAREAVNTGGIVADITSVSALPTGNALDADAKKKTYYLTADDSAAGFYKGDVVKWDADLDGWVPFEGVLR